jgi:hypothetical protein
MTVQQIHKIKSLADREKAILNASKYSKTALEAMTLNELRELGAYLIPNARKLKKLEFVDALYNICEQFKEGKKQELKHEIEDSDGLTDYKRLLLNGFKNEKDPVLLANEIYDSWELLLKTDKDDKKDGYTDTTIAKTNMSRIRTAKGFVTLENPDTEEFLNRFYNQLKVRNKAREKVINDSYVDEINIVKTIDDKTKLDGNKIINWAREIVESAAKKETKLITGWYQVTLALAILSGRRMEEIHGQSEHFPIVNRYYELRENNTIFINQLAKNPANIGFVFTPLIDSETWFKAFNNLPDSKLGLMENKVNQIVSSVLSKKLKNTYKELGIKQYKDSRDFYIAYRVKTEYKENKTNYNNESDFVQSIIGHNAKNSGHSYEKFVIKV